MLNGDKGAHARRGPVNEKEEWWDIEDFYSCSRNEDVRKKHTP